jgi:hypothetical protein
VIAAERRLAMRRMILAVALLAHNEANVEQKEK